MTKRRDSVPCLAAWYAHRHPRRPEKATFSDEVLALLDMLTAQLDRDGIRPLVFPPMIAEGAEPQHSVRASGRREALEP